MKTVKYGNRKKRKRGEKTMDKNELLQKLNNSRSWREAGVTLAEVINAFDTNVTSTSSNGDEKKYITEINTLKQENERLSAKVEKLSETNKKLREEIKNGK